MAENTNLKDYELALSAVRERTDFVPKVGIVLGSGLGGLADDIEIVTREFPIPNSRASRVRQ